MIKNTIQFITDSELKELYFTDHGRPLEHYNPHQHNYVENRTGGTRQRLEENELKMP